LHDIDVTRWRFCPGTAITRERAAQARALRRFALARAAMSPTNSTAPSLCAAWRTEASATARLPTGIDGAFGVTIGGERGILLGLRAGEG